MYKENYRGYNILIAHHQPIAVDLISFALKMKLPEVKLETLAPSAEMMHETSFDKVDAVIASHRLPCGSSGFDFIQTLRLQGFRGAIIIITTAEGAALSAKAAGADEYLPFEQWLDLPDRLEVLLTENTCGAR